MELNTLLTLATGLLLTVLLLKRLLTFLRLRHIPGPLPASLTTLWLVRLQLTGRINHSLRNLTARYGPIYRISPRWVVVSSPSEIRRVWAAKGQWYRSQWYDMFRFDQAADTVLSVKDNGSHTAIRSKLLPGYTGRDVTRGAFQEVVDEQIANLVHLINTKYTSTATEFRPMDLSQKAQFFTLDVISALAIGTSFENLVHDRDVYGQIAFVTGSVPLMAALASIPWSLSLLQNRLVRALLPQDKIEGVGRMMALAQKNTAKRLEQADSGLLNQDTPRRTMIDSFVAQGLPYTSVWLETFGSIGAGSDTTATAIRMTLFFLMTHPAAYRRLQEEIDSVVRSGRISSPVTVDESRRIPYLQAVIKEGLRCWPPVTGLMPKVCDVEEQVVCGKRIPRGTGVCWDAVSILRNKEVFGADAECFRPERWIDEAGADTRERLKEMELTQALCWGGGSRWECLGKTIALVELDKVFVELLRRFNFSLVDPVHPFKTYDASLSIQSDVWVRIEKKDG